MRGFFAAPLVRTAQGRRPAGSGTSPARSPSNSFDATGNAALLQIGVVGYLQGADLGVNDIFDPDQAAYFHLIRKEMRNVVILSAMYPDTNDDTREAVKPLDDLVDDYGDALEAFNAYKFALQAGMDTGQGARPSFGGSSSGP